MRRGFSGSSYNGVHLRRWHESLRKGEWVAFDEAASHDANVRGSVRRRELQINGRLVKEPTECPSGTKFRISNRF
jgi:hypothetical protein